MKKRIKFIFILMTISIFGMLIFQGYWLYHAYGIAYNRFKWEVNTALRDAIGRERIQRLQDYAKIHPGTESIDRRKIPGWYFLARKFKDSAYNLQHLDTLFSRELEDRSIDIRFHLDTATQSHVRRKHRLRRPQNNKSALQTRWIRLNPAENLFVSATFQPSYGYLFRKLFGVLAISFLLLIVVIGCFAYMMRTILRQKRLSDIKNDFINNMTHELKTPIAIVQAAIEALQHFQAIDNKEKTADYLDISNKELNRLSELVDRVMIDALAGESGFKLHLEKVNIDELIKEIIGVRELKRDKDISFAYTNTLPDKDMEVDKTHFTNMLNNMIDNAIKYSGDQVKIRITVEEREERGERLRSIAIADNGIGLSAIDRKLVFNKFYRVSTGDLHNIKGFGLGLSYVKNIIERHGGRVEVDSELGKGSCFTLFFPAKKNKRSSIYDQNIVGRR